MSTPAPAPKRKKLTPATTPAAMNLSPLPSTTTTTTTSTNQPMYTPPRTRGREKAKEDDNKETAIAQEDSEILLEAFRGWMTTYVGSGSAKIAERNAKMPIAKQVRLLHTALLGLSLNAAIIKNLLVQHGCTQEELQGRNAQQCVIYYLEQSEEKVAASEEQASALAAKLVANGIDAKGDNLEQVLQDRAATEAQLAEIEELKRSNQAFMIKVGEDKEAREKEYAEATAALELKFMEAIRNNETQVEEIDRIKTENAAAQKIIDELNQANATLKARNERLAERTEWKDLGDPAISSVMLDLERKHQVSLNDRADLPLSEFDAEDAQDDIATDLKARALERGAEKAIDPSASNEESSLGLKMRAYTGSFRGAFNLGAELWEKFPDALDSLHAIRHAFKKETTTHVSTEEIQGVLLFSALCTKYPLLLGCRLPFRDLVLNFPRILHRDLVADQFGRAFRSEDPENTDP